MIDLRILNELIEDRNKTADIIENNESTCNISTIVTNENADKAHFIFELLQNADDVLAEEAEFILEDNYLIFAHNRKRKFTVTHPNKDKQSDIKNLGDLNSLTAYANSSKKDNETNKIGKFGMGCRLSSR